MKCVWGEALWLAPWLRSQLAWGGTECMHASPRSARSQTTAVFVRPTSLEEQRAAR